MLPVVPCNGALYMLLLTARSINIGFSMPKKIVQLPNHVAYLFLMTIKKVTYDVQSSDLT